MATPVCTPLEEYLAHTYKPDCEYVDGQLIERNVGEYFHSLLQALLTHYLCGERDRTGIPFRTLTEQRVRLREGLDHQRRYRIPDVAVLGPGYRRTGVTLDPPALTIEILSPDDTLRELVAKSQEYVVFGVPVALLADLYARRVYQVLESGESEIVDRVARFSVGGVEIPIDFNQLFLEMDRD